MGLCLNYELRLPIETSAPDVHRVVHALRDHAVTLPFRQVGPVARAKPSALTIRGRRHSPAIAFHATILAGPFEDDTPQLIGDPATAIGFLVNPGEGCETAFFGFLKRATTDGAPKEWWWHCSCKTQYASTVSDAHLLMCHTSLVAVLDHAVKLGVDVTVRDEGAYWDTRDPQRLLAEVREMNRLVARIAGRISDAVQSQLGDSHKVHASIFAHPRFERLEMGE